MNSFFLYLLIYFVILFSIGIYYFFKVKNANDYLIGSWNMGFWPIVGTVVSTWLGASVFIGAVTLGYSMGLSSFFRYSIGPLLFTLILVAVFGRCLRRQKLYTLADLFGQRFGKKVGILPSILSTFIYAIPAVTIQYIAMNTIWVTILKLDPTTGLVLSALIIFTFTVLGGLPATIITDALQAIFILLGILILTYSSFLYAQEFIANGITPPATHLTPMGEYTFLELIYGILSVGPFFLVWQAGWQRIFAARTEKIALTANFTALIICTFIAFCPIIIGICAKIAFPPFQNPDLIFSFLTQKLLSQHTSSFIYCALLSALVTSANSIVLQGSSSLTYDLYQKIINPQATNKEILLVSRLTILFVCFVALIVAMNFDGIFSIYQWALRLTATTLIIPFLATMFIKQVTKTGILCSMWAGLIGTLTWTWLNIDIDQTVFGFLISGLGLLIGTLCSKHDKEEYIVAVFFNDLPSAKN